VSFAQEWMWLFEQIASSAYNLLFALRLTGPLNREILERSLNALLQRHEVLRTTLTFEHEQLQIVKPTPALPVPGDYAQ